MNEQDKREKVIRGLECCCGGSQDYGICEECPYTTNKKTCYLPVLHRDALELLKAQEPVKPLILVKDAALSNGAKYLCGKCGGSFFHQKVNFCPWCGKAVNWE